MKTTITHFHPWERFPGEELTRLLAEFANNGMRHLSLSPKSSEKAIAEPEYVDFLLTESRKAGLRFLDVHAPYGERWDLNCADPARRPGMLEEQTRLLKIAARFGAQTVTVHVGNNDSGRPLEELHGNAARSLEVLLPAAEAAGIVLAMENTLFPTDTPEKLLSLRARFPTPALGFCLDAGHAFLMDKAPGKAPAQMVHWIRRRWRDNVQFSADTVGALLADTVTCHIHDNDGYDDKHQWPGEGSIDWGTLFKRLKKAPRLLSLQDETNHLLYSVTVPQMAERYRELTAGVTA